MIYEPLRTGAGECIVFYQKARKYYAHRQVEFEIIFCIKDSFPIIIENKLYELNEGELAIVSPMLSHEFPEPTPKNSAVYLVIIAGPSMLGSSYKILSSKAFGSPIIDTNCPEHNQLKILMEDLYGYRKNHTPSSALNIKSLVYKIFAYFIENFESDNEKATNKLLSLISIEPAINYIQNNYSEKITVKHIASMCGYSESNFCNVFKNLTGQTFHHFLNNRRVEIACELLRSSTLSVGEIAQQVGFEEAQSFCRVFKAFMKTSPGKYRKHIYNA